MAFKKFNASQSDVQDPAQLQRTINTVQQNVETEFRNVSVNTLLDNRIVKDVIINTSTSVQHKLGRVPQGYIIISKSANAQIWNDAPTDTVIAFYSSANVTATILVF